MPALALVAEVDRLQAAAWRINEAHERAQAAGHQHLEAARAAGEEMIAVKREVGHGGWLAWLEKNCKTVKPRCAQYYMHVARHWEAIKNARPAYLADAVRLIDGLNPEPEVEPIDPRQIALFAPEEVPVPPDVPPPDPIMGRRAAALVRMIVGLERKGFFDTDISSREIARAVEGGDHLTLVEGLPRICSWFLFLREDIAGRGR